ncbi:MAG: hypothetical protein GY847_28450 [Proteobacteria bacterium]|nr:hypothetical protein [Pseudomonadota bacterium]
MECRLCSGAIEGEPFTLSDLTESGGLLEVCRECAGSQYITVKIDGMEIEIHRDNYIEADREKLELAISMNWSRLAGIERD